VGDGLKVLQRLKESKNLHVEKESVRERREKRGREKPIPTYRVLQGSIRWALTRFLVT